MNYIFNKFLIHFPVLCKAHASVAHLLPTHKGYFNLINLENNVPKTMKLNLKIKKIKSVK